MPLSRRQVLGIVAAAAAARPLRAANRRVHIVPNFHPASCGWLTHFSKERVYCANSYFDHLDRVRDDRQYAFVLSEVNNLIAMMNFRPERMEELKQRIREGRVELVNAFFLESTINLSGGEALVRLGVEGIRWQQKMFGVRPRFAWTIDVCGTHDQMAQISAGLGLDAMVYTRKNPTGSAVHWSESPDSTRVLTFSPGHYSELRTLMMARDPLTAAETSEIEKHIEGKEAITPEGAPLLILAGGGDYALAPARKQYPREFLEAWKQNPSHAPLRFSTLSQYADELLPAVRSGKVSLPTMRGGTAYDYSSFWIECPRVKAWYRRSEHALQAAEMLAAAASLHSKMVYPARELYQAWTLLFLNMDRNTLWGSAGGMVFEHDRSWDVKDRFEWVGEHTAAILRSAGAHLLPDGDGVALFNPLSWNRRDPIVLPAESVPADTTAQGIGEGRVLCQPKLPASSIAGFRSAGKAFPVGPLSALPARIDTTFYSIQVDAKTGALHSITLRGSGREMLGGPANVVVAEKPKVQRGEPGDFMAARPDRVRVASTSDAPADIRVWQGELATIVECKAPFAGGGMCRRRMTFCHDYPRIDFETELNDVPDRTVVVAEFPLSADITEVRRAIPYGFSHGTWSKPNAKLHGWTKGIVPAVRWSHYSVEGGGGVAILDRGLTGRELNDRTAVVYLYNATEKYRGYPNSWLSGKGTHHLEYALVVHEGEWRQARIPQMAWEFNCPPVLTPAREVQTIRPILRASDNVIVEAVRRTGSDIEVRLVECLGYSGTAELTLLLPHKSAALTSLTGDNPKPLGGGPVYRFPVRPQQIVTLRFRTTNAVAEPEVVTSWDEMTPPAKRALLHEYTEEKGHPPSGN